MPKRDTYLTHLDELPPYLCWVLARQGRKAITQEELARRTRWSRAKVERFCRLRTWAKVRVIEADIFRLACGVRKGTERRHKYYLKRTLDKTQTINGLAHFNSHGPLAVQALKRT